MQCRRRDLPPEIAHGIATGVIHPETHAPFEDTQPAVDAVCFSASLRWSTLLLQKMSGYQELYFKTFGAAARANSSAPAFFISTSPSSASSGARSRSFNVKPKAAPVTQTNKLESYFGLLLVF